MNTFTELKKAVWAAWMDHLFMSFTPVEFYVLLSAFKAPCVYTLRTYLLTYLHWEKKKISVPEDCQCGIQFLLYIHAGSG